MQATTNFRRRALACGTSALIVALLTGSGAARAQQIVDYDDLPTEVKEALQTIENHFAQEIAIADFSTVDHSSGDPEPQRVVVVDSKRATEAGAGPKDANNAQVQTLDARSEVTVVISASPACELQQVGGRYYWVPSPPCPR